MSVKRNPSQVLYTPAEMISLVLSIDLEKELEVYLTLFKINPLRVSQMTFFSGETNPLDGEIENLSSVLEEGYVDWNVGSFGSRWRDISYRGVNRRIAFYSQKYDDISDKTSKKYMIYVME